MALAVVALSLAEIERLAILMEECGEIVQIVARVERYGFDATDPTKPAAPTHRRTLEKEVGDLLASIVLLTEAQDLDLPRILRRVPSKLDKLCRYVQHQEAVLRSADASVSRWMQSVSLTAERR